MKKVLGILLSVMVVFGLTACELFPSQKPTTPTDTEGSNPTETLKGYKDPKTYTYNTYTTISPSNWNELTYQDSNDTQILSYVSSSFFGYDFKLDENGEIVEGGFEVEYVGAKGLVDVTTTYAGDEKYAVPADATSGYAWKIVLREDLCWENGDEIKAKDFVYSMQQQLDPLFKNYRADSYYNSGTVIHGAKAYVKQGPDLGTIDDLIEVGAVKDAAEFIEKYGNQKAYINWDYSFGVNLVTGGAAEDKIVDSTLTAAELYEIFTTVAGGGYAKYASSEMYIDFEFPAADWDSVGIFVGDTEYELVIVLDKPIELLKEDKSLSYLAAYQLSGLPLVHEKTYEANKVKPIEGSTLWTTTYYTSKESTISWGPYKLASFQDGKEYVLERNDKWFGYKDDMYADYYQTDRIVCETVAEYNTQLMMFNAGEIDGVGIDVSVATDYKNSARAYFTPDDFVGSLQIQSDETALAKRESEGVNKTILANVKFRKALSLSIDRAAYNNQCTTSSLAGYGIFNSMHYYDVANGGAYRNTDPAKEVLCKVYAVNPDDYATLDDAVDAITGFNLAEARKLVDEAYDETFAAGKIKATDKVVIAMGSGAINETVTRRFNFIRDCWLELVKGTKLEGRLEFSEYEDRQSAWANDFRAGGYDICTGGWSGAAWDPGYFLLAYLHPSYMYSTAWPTDKIEMTFTMPKGGENGEDVTETMSLLDWYYCLNGIPGAAYNWSAGAIDDSSRLELIAALEEQILSAYYSIPISYSFGASLISYKLDYVTYEYNTFMGYGGIMYATYNYDDVAWDAYVASQNGQLNYKG